ncbi:MAG: TPM domain-containing protein [Acidobacteria bacterium]|nr:TPM domain-containing protein [Acidobacteriota bacterium]
MNKFSVPVLSALLLLLGTQAVAQVKVPAKPSNYVTDLAGIIDPEREALLNAYLGRFESATTAQVFVLTIESLEGASIEDFAVRVAHDMWRVGQEGKDNGALLLVSLRDRRMRLEIGYGLEGILTDAFSRRVIDQDLIPYFRQGDYSGGIVSAVRTITRTIAADAGIQLPEETLPAGVRADPRRGSPTEPATPLQKVFSVLLVIAGIFLFIKYPRLFLLLLLMSGGGRRGGWSGGGGFGGGGFGGGGGGGFGGGGASGSW